MDPYGLGVQWDPASGQPQPNPAFGGQSVYVPAPAPLTQPGFNPGLPTAGLPANGGPVPGGQGIPPSLLLWLIMGGGGQVPELGGLPSGAGPLLGGGPSGPGGY